MATIRPTFTLAANASTSTRTPGPLTWALSLSQSSTLTVDNVDAFTSNVRTTNDAAGYDKVNHEVGFDRQTLIDGSDSGHDAAAAKSDGTTLTHNGCWVYVYNCSPSTSKHIIAIGHTTDADAAHDADTSGSAELTALVDANTDTHADANQRLFSLRAGEWAFFPYDFTGDLYCQATGASQKLEFWRFDRA
tara:strand:+ start:1263 stop:1835 length:573 start_codon:yes stop_codon:yes gene_type:complete